MSLVQLEVDRESDSEHFYTCDIEYLCLPHQLPKAGPIVATLKREHEYEDNTGARKLSQPTITMVQSKKGALTSSQREKAQALLNELRAGPDVASLDQVKESLKEQFNIAQLRKKYDQAPLGRWFCDELAELVNKAQLSLSGLRERTQEEHRSQKRRELRGLLQYPKAWEEV
jgi:hypothetical protein